MGRFSALKHPDFTGEKAAFWWLFMVKFGAILRAYFLGRGSVDVLDNFSSDAGLINENMSQLTGFLMVAYDV